jgi:hypothetical protein
MIHSQRSTLGADFHLRHRDALNRHLSRCKHAQAGARVRSSRVNNACVPCSERKVKCSKEKTCRRCLTLHLDCTYAYHGSIGTAGHAATSSSPVESTDTNPHSLVSPLSLDGEHQECRPSVPVPVMTQQFSPTATSVHESTASVQDVQFSDTTDVMPWLSWDWTDQTSANSAHAALSIWSDPMGTPDPLLLVDGKWSSVSGNQVAPDGLEDYFHPSLQPSSSINMLDSKLDPVEHHRNKIIEYLRTHTKPSAQRHYIRWLERENFQILLKTYFNRHHRHTPIIHLATFNVVSCPTSLIFAIALVAASYIPRLGLRTRDTQDLAETAYSFALHSDEVRPTSEQLNGKVEANQIARRQSLESNGIASLETLQALILLSILDRLLVKKELGSIPSIDLGAIVRMARSACVFDDPRNHHTIDWHTWARNESHRRQARSHPPYRPVDVDAPC